MSSYEKEIRSIIEKAGIPVNKNTIENVKKMYLQISMDTLNNLNKITLHRGGNKIELGDLFLFKSLLNDKLMMGGNYLVQYGASSPDNMNHNHANPPPNVTGGVTNKMCAGEPSQCSSEIVPVQAGGGFKQYIKSLKKIKKNKNIFGFLNYDGKNRFYTQCGGSLSDDNFEKIIENTLAFDISDDTKKPLKSIIENEVVNQLVSYYSRENDSVENDSNDNETKQQTDLSEDEQQGGEQESEEQEDSEQEDSEQEGDEQEDREQEDREQEDREQEGGEQEDREQESEEENREVELEDEEAEEENEEVELREEESEEQEDREQEDDSNYDLKNLQYGGEIDVISQIDNLKSNFMKQLDRLKSIENTNQSGGFDLGTNQLYNDILSMKNHIRKNINNLDSMKQRHNSDNQTGGSFSHILDPKTKKKVPVNSLLGESIINMYKNYLN